MKVLCIGHATYDITLPISEYPVENKKMRIGNKKIECGGGPASNAAYLLGLWGTETYFLGVTGNDYYGDLIKEEFKKVRVNTDYLVKLPHKVTTTSYIMANSINGSRTIITNKDSGMYLDDSVNIEIQPDLILCDGDSWSVALKLIRENKDAVSILDAGSIKEGSIKLAGAVDYLVCSNDFAKEYTKIDFAYDDIGNIKRVYDKLVDDFHNHVIITLESFGCFTKIDNEYMLIPSIKVKAIDGTGAGDIFHGAFTYFIGNGYKLYDSLCLANIAGALSVTKLGGRISAPSLDEVLNVYHRK